MSKLVVYVVEASRSRVGLCRVECDIFEFFTFYHYQIPIPLSSHSAS